MGGGRRSGVRLDRGKGSWATGDGEVTGNAAKGWVAKGKSDRAQDNSGRAASVGAG